MAATQALLSASTPLSTVGHTAPEAEDDFFSEEVGLHVAFDFDYDEIIAFNSKVQWAQFLFAPPMWCSAICCYPCFLTQNIEWNSRAKHVALTVDGIRYVQEKHPAGCGLACQDKGKESKTVPYDKITDCDVQEPAGTACLCCIERTLSTVVVDTASSGGGTAEGGVRHDLVLEGLSCPNEFKRAVWDMKRGTAGAHAPAAGGKAAGPLAAPQQEDMTMGVLVEIRDELRRLNTLMERKG